MCVCACVSMNGCMSVVHYTHVLLANVQYNCIHNELLLPTFVTVHSPVSDSNICEIYMSLSLYSTSLTRLSLQICSSPTVSTVTVESKVSLVTTKSRILIPTVERLSVCKVKLLMSRISQMQ